MNTDQTLGGTITALATPFNHDGSEVDFESLDRLIEFQLSNRVDGVLACGSTGEAATLSEEEYCAVVSHTYDSVQGKARCLAAIGLTSTAAAVTRAEFCRSLDLDGILVSPPPYVKPSQAGIVAHFEAIAEASGLPLVAYNIPGRTGVSIEPETLLSAARDHIIVGVKDATGSVQSAGTLLAQLDCQFSLLSGEDNLVIPLMSLGGRGVVSASANVIPDQFVAMTSNALKGDWAAASSAQLKAWPLIAALFNETNPVPLKSALVSKGIIAHQTVRLPLLQATAKTNARLREVGL